MSFISDSKRQFMAFALVEAQFESILAFKEDISKHVPLETLFEVLDNDHDGRIDGLEFLGGLALCCQGSFEEKAKFCFMMYDFNLNSQMSRKEMTMMIMASICGLNLLTGGGEASEPSMEKLDEIVEDAFQRADRDRSGHISYDEFVSWARSNRDIMANIEVLNKLALTAKLECVSEDSADEASEGDLSDAEQSNERGKISSFANASGGDEGAAPPTDKKTEVISKDVDYVQWKMNIFEPTGFAASSRISRGPGVNLELAWAHGVRAGTSRNNVKYVIPSTLSGKSDSIEETAEATQIVFPSASLGVVYDKVTRRQKLLSGARCRGILCGCTPHRHDCCHC